jgi:hypothetical protein
VYTVALTFQDMGSLKSSGTKIPLDTVTSITDSVCILFNTVLKATKYNCRSHLIHHCLFKAKAPSPSIPLLKEVKTTWCKFRDCRSGKASKYFAQQAPGTHTVADIPGHCHANKFFKANFLGCFQ